MHPPFRPPLDPTHAYFDHITHHLDVRAHAAWNARSLIRNKVPPFIIMADFFGERPPISDFGVMPLNIADFNTGNPHATGHGYHVLGIIAANYGGDSWRDSTTGMYPGSGSDVLTLSAVDAQWGHSHLDIRQKLMELLEPLRTFHRVGVILNTSMGDKCPSGDLLDTSCIEPRALTWLEQVRGPALWPTGLSGLESLENRFLHVTSAGNASAPGDTAAVMNSEWTAARLLSGLVVPETGNSLANLTNTLVIENRDRSPVLLGGTPGCLAANSKFSGDLAAVGTNVFSLTGPQYGAGPLSGASMATPQVAGLAAYMWTIKPFFTPQEIMDILITTADPSPCGGPQSAPVIDAYAAVLALDQDYPSSGIRSTGLVRKAILDLNNDWFFDETDVKQFLAEFEAANGAKDYSRYDLNGDGKTGGDSKAKFNLNMDYAPYYGTVYQFIEGSSVSFDENSLTDLDILCYYAYSRIYVGSDDDRKDLLKEKCGKEPTIEVMYFRAYAISGEDSGNWKDDCYQDLFLGDQSSNTQLSIPVGLAPSCAPYAQSTTTVDEAAKGHLSMFFAGMANRVNVPWACDPPSPNCYYAVYSSTGSEVSGRILTAGTYTVEMSLSPAFDPPSAEQRASLGFGINFVGGGYREISCTWINRSYDPVRSCHDGQTNFPLPVGPFTVDIDVPRDGVNDWSFRISISSSPYWSSTPPADISLTSQVFSIKPK